MHEKSRREENVFVELIPLLKDRTLLITVAGIDGKLKVNLIRAKVKEGEEQALTTPLSFTGSAEELDAELGSHLAAYVQSHMECAILWPRRRRRWMRQPRPRARG
jgi:PRTRC genetic system protein E